MKKLLPVLLLLPVNLAFAQVVPRTDASPWAWPYTTTGSIVTPNGVSAGQNNAARAAWSTASDGGIVAQTSGRLPVTAGSGAIVDITAKATKSSAILAVGKFAVKALPVLSIGVALYDLASDLDVVASNNPDGSAKFEKKQTSTVCPNVNYQLSTYRNDSLVSSAKYCVPLTATSTTFVYGWSHKSSAYGWPGVEFPCGNASCQTGYVNQDIGYTTNAPLKTVVPMSLQEFLDALDSRTSWGSSSPFARTVVDAMKSGETIPLVPTAVTGPATGTPSVTTTVDGTKTTTTTVTEKLTYPSGSPRVVTTKDTVISTTDSATGVTTTTTETSTVPPAAATITCGLPDTPACKIDETGTPTTEDGVGKRTKELKDTYKPIEDFVKDPSTLGKPFPTLTWSFALPSNCSIIPLGTSFEPFISSIDVCQFQPMFHQLMSVVWSIGALFGAIGLLMKNSQAT